MGAEICGGVVVLWAVRVRILVERIAGDAAGPDCVRARCCWKYALAAARVAALATGVRSGMRAAVSGCGRVCAASVCVAEAGVWSMRAAA